MTRNSLADTSHYTQLTLGIIFFLTPKQWYHKNISIYISNWSEFISVYWLLSSVCVARLVIKPNNASAFFMLKKIILLCRVKLEQSFWICVHKGSTWAIPTEPGYFRADWDSNWTNWNTNVNSSNDPRPITTTTNWFSACWSITTSGCYTITIATATIWSCRAIRRCSSWAICR